MTFKWFCLAIAATLMGCSSEIDKCVNSQIKAWEVAKKEAQARLDEKKGDVRVADVLEDIDLTTTPIEKVEADVRLKCMKAYNFK